MIWAPAGTNKGLPGMASIQFWGSTYDGTAEGEYGVFTKPKYGHVFTGSHSNGCARVGVHTRTGGYTDFVECDADGKRHGRFLTCCDNGKGTRTSSSATPTGRDTGVS